METLVLSVAVFSLGYAWGIRRRDVLTDYLLVSQQQRGDYWQARHRDLLDEFEGSRGDQEEV